MEVKEAAVAILLSNKSTVENRCYKLIKAMIHQKNLKIQDVYVPYSRASKYMKQQLTELKGGR